MARQDPEAELRREAIRRRLEGARPCEISRGLGRSRGWLYKWCTQFPTHPHPDLTSRSRAAHTIFGKTSAAVEQTVVRIRRAFEQAATPTTRYGLIGHRAIRSELERLRVEPLPSSATIQRILHAHGLT